MCLRFVAGGGGGEVAAFFGEALVRVPPSGGLCLLCDKEFASFGNATRHFKEKHVGDSSRVGHFACHLCGISFTTERAAQRHCSEKHAAERQAFPCPNCNKIFSVARGMKAHLSLCKSPHTSTATIMLNDLP